MPAPVSADSALVLVLGCDDGDLGDKKSKPKRESWNITVVREVWGRGVFGQDASF